MSAFISAVRPFLEILYFVASILMLGGLGLAYRQLVIIQRDIRIRNQRAAAEKAIDASDRYLCHFVPVQATNFDERRSRKLSSYNGPIGDFTPESIPKGLFDECHSRLKLDSWLPSMNILESIAAGFVAGVADEQTGFRVVGRTFCSAVEECYDIIALCRMEKTNASWTNIVELYWIWRPRLTKTELEAAKKEMECKLAACPGKSVPPIGTAG
jgi:hypothetical protein